MALSGFRSLAARPDPPLDELALALAGEFRDVDAAKALADLDGLGAELAGSAGGSPQAEAAAIRALLGDREGFVGNRADYDNPDNSMLDLVLERRKGLPIVLSVAYVEVARRAGIPLVGVGLPGHFVVGHAGASPPILLDPFSRGRDVTAEVKARDVRAWSAREIALRMLHNLVGSYAVRGDLGLAIRAAELRLHLPAASELKETLAAELRGLRARLN